MNHLYGELELCNRSCVGRKTSKAAYVSKFIGQVTRLIYLWQAWALMYASDVIILAWCYHPFPDCNNYRNTKKAFMSWSTCHPMYKEASNPLSVFPSFLDHVSNTDTGDFMLV